jgi:uncharacterized ion transporter superfamily protein YfcC
VFFAIPSFTHSWPNSAACWSPAIPAIGIRVPLHQVWLEFTPVRKIILVIFALAFAVMIYGVAVLGWWMAQISAVFLASAIIVGLIARMSEEELTSTFINGARDLLGVALIIGIARGIVVIRDQQNATKPQT